MMQRDPPVARRVSFLSTALFRVVDSPRLADHGHFDLTRIGQLALDALDDVARHQLGGGVVDLLGLHDDADLAACLHCERALHSREGGGYRPQLLEPLKEVDYYLT